MHRFFLLFVTSLLLLAQSACQSDVKPAKRCFITDYTSVPGLAQQAELSPAKLPELNAWILKHRDQWKTQIADLPPTGIELRLEHDKGPNTYVRFQGDRLWIKNHCRVLSASERSELLALLNPESRLPIFPYQR